MAELAFPFTANAVGDGRAYTALEWSEFWRNAYLRGNEASQGVLKGVLNELAVTGTASPLSVNTGTALVYGKFYRNDASKTLAVTTPSVGTTGGHVILQLDWTAQTVRAVAVRNTDGINSTPALTQSLSTQWEIRLASFTITTGGVITLTDTRAYAHFATMVATAQIDDLAVTAAKLAADAVTTTKILDANVTLAKLATDSVDASKISAGAVGTSELADGNVTLAKLAADSVDASKISAGAVGTSELAADSVDDTKAGDRVPQFYRRQGGSATNWDTSGTGTQTPTAVRMQAGAITWTGGASQFGSVVITFPTGFSNPPLLFVSVVDAAVAAGIEPDATFPNTQASINWQTTDGSTKTSVKLRWFAVGSE